MQRVNTKAPRHLGQSITPALKPGKTLAEIMQDFATTKWNEINSTRGGWQGVDSDTVVTSVNKGFSKNARSRIHARIGDDIRKLLGWETNDRICAYAHPDDDFIFLLVKSDNGIGFKLNRETGKSNTHMIGFPYPHDTFIETRKSQLTNFDLHDKTLVIELPRL